MGQWGEVQETPRGLQLAWAEGRHLTEVEMTKTQLLDYVADYVRWRTEHGLGDGLDNGLPMPLLDSFGDCFGPQEAPYARLALVGLDFHLVSNQA